MCAEFKKKKTIDIDINTYLLQTKSLNQVPAQVALPKRFILRSQFWILCPKHFCQQFNNLEAFFIIIALKQSTDSLNFKVNKHSIHDLFLGYPGLSNLQKTNKTTTYMNPDGKVYIPKFFDKTECYNKCFNHLKLHFSSTVIWKHVLRFLLNTKSLSYHSGYFLNE